jgi:dihydroneopterin aldolase
MRIFVEHLEFVGHHGVYEEERREGRRFAADLSVDVNRPAGARTDDIEDTLDYRALADVILEVGEGPSRHLIERLASEMLDRLFEEYAAIRAAELTLRKYATGVPGAPDSVGITVTRQRADD